MIKEITEIPSKNKQKTKVQRCREDIQYALDKGIHVFMMEGEGYHTQSIGQTVIDACNQVFAELCNKAADKKLPDYGELPRSFKFNRWHINKENSLYRVESHRNKETKQVDCYVELHPENIDKFVDDFLKARSVRKNNERRAVQSVDRTCW